MIILGIDPGSRITGFGVIKIVANKCHYVTSGCIKITETEVGNRLKQIFDGLSQVIASTNPDTSSIEQIFMFQNPGAAIKLGQARGVALLSLAHHGLSISEYSAKQVKKAVVGTGAATKHQVQNMVQIILDLNDKPQEDAADALAMAICHYHSSQGLLNVTEAKKIVHGRLRR